MLCVVVCVYVVYMYVCRVEGTTTYVISIFHIFYMSVERVCNFNSSFESNAKYVVFLHHHKCSRQPSAAISLRDDVEILRCCFLEQQDDLSPRP